jgi:hypothetical protein
MLVIQADLANKAKTMRIRRKVAAACWFAAAGILITCGHDKGTLFEWHEILFILWIGVRIGFLAYTGILLWDADKEIDSLKHTENRLQEIIAELQESPSG